MEELLEIIKAYVPDIESNTEQALLEDALIDSIQLVEIINDICEKFEIDIEGADIDPDNFQTVKTIWKLIQRLKEK